MFKFRLQRVLDHRAGLEKEAKQLFMEAQSARVRGEIEIQEVREERVQLGNTKVDGLVGHIELQSLFLKVDDDEKAAKIALGVLLDEEGAAQERWQVVKRDLQIIEKLRDRAKEEWLVEENRREQAALDEWAVLRRHA